MSEATLKTAAESVRWIFILSCGVAYLLFAYLASLDFRPNQGVPQPSNLWDWSTSVIRHVVLVPGLLPLIVVVVWLWRATSWRAFAIGAALAGAMLVYHYVLFAVSAHSDSAYPWFQAGELLIFAFALRLMLRSSGA
jgi:hypothetical protein